MVSKRRNQQQLFVLLYRKELRESLKEMYSDLENKSQIYELTLKVREIQQEVIMSQNTSIP
jgi:hypothetical protein